MTMPDAPVPTSTELKAMEAAQAMRTPYRTAVRWFRFWLARKVEGVREIHARGRSGLSLRIDPSVIDRWRRGELPRYSGPKRR